MRVLTIVLVLGAGLASAASSEPTGAPLSSEAFAKAMDQCKADSSAAFGVTAPEAGASNMPRMIRTVAPRAKGSGRWAGVALIAPDGTVRDVWAVQGVDEKTDKAVVEAIRKWRYDAPKTSDGKAEPLCSLVTVNLH
jgi:hypothetical protein